jgi:hypothetical protein
LERPLDELTDDVTDSGLGLSPTQAERVEDEARRGAGGLGDAARPSGRAEVVDEETELTTIPHNLDTTDADAAGLDVAGVESPDLEPSLMDQPILTDPMAAVGDRDDTSDPVANGDEVYVPPVDPVVATDRHGEATVLGGFATSAEEEIAPRRSSDGSIGDEALVDAVQSALRHDAATADLDIEVTVARGVVRLRGRVPGPEDAESAEAVAGRVEGVAEVLEELQVAEL